MAQRGWLRVEERKAGETWVLRFEVVRPTDGKRVENTKAIGLVRDFPTETLARAEADRQCPNLNEPEFKGKVTFAELAQFYVREELKTESNRKRDRLKAASTIEDRNRILSKRLIPRWGDRDALSIRPLEIRKWLESIQDAEDLGNSTVKKIRDVMSFVYTTGIENGLVPLKEDTNPLKFVPTSAMSDYVALVVKPEKAFEILMDMKQPERTLTLLISATGLRISEALGLKWEDIDCVRSRINISRAYVGGVLGKPKSKASQAPVPLHPVLAAFLREWQQQTVYSGPGDWVFASDRLNGKQPRSANMLVEDHLRPAAVRAGVIKEGEKVRFGFHNLRHSLVTYLVNANVDPKTVQALARHSDVHTTLQLYAQSSPEKGLAAQGKMLEAMGMVN
jgi:integrase